MTALYLYGYGDGPWGASTTLRSREYILAQPQWSLVHPEIMRREFALADFVISHDRQYGFGGGGRSTIQQYNLFKSRYVRVAVGASYDVFWNGKPSWPSEAGYYRHVSGASAAPPGLSYHEQTTGNGAVYALALDAVGDLAFANQYCGNFGLLHFAAVNGEPWHHQGVEYPKSRSQYTGQFENPAPWLLPGTADDDMTPIKPTRVYDSRQTGGPFGAGEVRRVPVVLGIQASIGGGCQGGTGWWAYSPDGDFSAPASFVNVNNDGTWVSWGAIPVLAPGGHVYIKSQAGGHLYVDTYAQKQS